MNTLTETIHFSKPYIRRYWPRFVMGVVLGLLFGLSNGLIAGALYMVSNRVTDPNAVQYTVTQGEEAKAQASAAREEKANEPEDPTVKALKVRGATLKQEIYLTLDPWLPLKGRALDWKQVLGGLLILPLFVALRGLLGYGSSYLLAWSGLRITNDVKTDAFRKISSLSLDYFQKTTTQELIARIEADGASLNNFLRMGMSDLVKEPSTIVCLLISMLIFNWKFTLIALFYVPLCIIPVQRVSKRVKELNRKSFDTNVGQGNITLESFQNVRITKAYSLEDIHARMYRKGAERSAYYSLKTIQSREMLNPIVQVFSTFAITLVLLYAFWTNTNAATIAAFLLSLGLFGASVKKINVIGVYWNQLSVSLDRLLALFALQPSVKESPNALPMAAFSRSIDVRNVTFSYGDAPVLQDISFSLARGQRLGLAGESGSGKSSLINLLFRFYDPTSGRIEIDGVPITDLRIADLRFHLALVSQDILLFNATVAENIAFGKIGATRDEVIAAAREAYAHDFIEALPQGYDTPLGERGQRLSGGQRQRIAIARAFVRNAPILVLDEATASLDSQAEAEVQGAIDHLAENRTVICVAHRLSTLRGMDRILVLEKGRIVEQGTFDQLLAQRGIFTAMAARQSIFPQAA
jgi:subfamily B ATP-binding cassette protein MsbA